MRMLAFIKGRSVFVVSLVLSLGFFVTTESYAQYVKKAYYYSLYKPYKSGTSVKGKAKVTELCSRDSKLRNCKWHTSVERSSWRGYQTVKGSIKNNVRGWQYPKGTMLKGTYTYKTHVDARSEWKTRCYNSVAKGWYSCWLRGRWRADSSPKRLTRR